MSVSKDLFDVFVAVSGVEGQIYDLVVRITEAQHTVLGIALSSVHYRL